MQFAPQVDEEPASQAQVSEQATSRDGSQEKLLVNGDDREESARVRVLEQLHKQQRTFENPQFEEVEQYHLNLDTEQNESENQPKDVPSHETPREILSQENSDA